MWNSILRPPMARNLLALACVIGLVPAARAEEKPRDVNEALYLHAGTVIEKLRKDGCENVGVLKFLVKQGDKRHDNVGPLNQNLANRLEVALVLKNPDEKLGIVARAGEHVAKNNKTANHMDAKGRRAVFDLGRFPLAWQSQDNDKKDGVNPDVFVYGEVEFSPDQKNVTVALRGFKDDGKEFELSRFTAPADAPTLTEAGLCSFRGKGGVFSGDRVVVREDSSVKPAQHEKPVEAPVELKVYYDDKEKPIRVDGARSSVPEPTMGQKVHFVLINKSDKDTYGVVLRVNGENTLFKERGDGVKCHMWVLGPGKHVKVSGYQENDKEFREFDVLPVWKTSAAKVNYGQHAGTFTLEVFRADDGKIKPADTGEHLAAVQAGNLPRGKDQPGSLISLREKLLPKGPSNPDVRERGLIGEGEKKPGDVQRIAFKPHPERVLSATIYYCNP